MNVISPSCPSDINLCETAQRLVPILQAAADEIETTRRIPQNIVDTLHDARLFHLLLPKRLNGLEMAPTNYAEVLEIIAGADASVAWNLFVGNSSALIAPFLTAEIGTEIFKTPNTVIAWGPPTKAIADVVEGGYRLSGRWDFASGIRQANWLGAHVRIREQNGELRKNKHGLSVLRTLLFPIEKGEIFDTWDPIGLKGTASDSYEVQDLFVADAFTSTREEPENRIDPGPLYAFPMQGLYAVGVAAVALGIAQAMHQAFKDLAQEKAPRGIGRLSDNTQTRDEVARNEAALGSARAYLHATLSSLYECAGEKIVLDIPERAQVRLAASNAIQQSIQVGDRVYKAAGVSAIFPGTPFERRFRDLHTLSQQIQSRNSHFAAVGEVLLGGEPALFF